MPSYQTESGRGDIVGVYLRQVGDIPRLSTEEELHWARDFVSSRDQVLHVAASHPDLFRTLLRRRLDAGEMRLSAGIEQLLAALDQACDAQTKLKAEGSEEWDRLLPLIEGRVFEAAAFCRFGAELLAAVIEMIRPSAPEQIKSAQKSLQQMESASRAMVEGNLRLVVSIARRYSRSQEHFLDLIQEGNMGLLAAVERFDPALGYNFSTYATWWIRQSVGRARQQVGRTVRLPSNMIAQISLVRKAERRLVMANGHEPSDEEVSAECGLSVAKVRALSRMAQQTVSLQAADEDKSEFGSFVPDDSADSPDEVAERSFLRQSLNETLSALSERERLILRLRFGMEDGQYHTLEDVGARFGISRERIRQLETTALDKMRSPEQAHRLGMESR
ncbi:MAG: hypothetical protein RL095_3611 [Verrucomicrobiota bacterium]|jgi:RNA polymerase sigma factor (sigma-70 family)